MISKKDIQVFGGKHHILLHESEYIFLLPHPDLRKYISNYTITFPPKEISDRYTIMPHGSATLVISNNTKNLYVELFGPITKPTIVGNKSTEMLVIIEFQPAGLYALTGINQSELTDETFSFESVNLALSRLLSEAVEKAENISELVTSLDMILLENMYTTFHPQFSTVFQSMINCAGNTTIRKLSDDIHYSERQLNNIFKQHVGVSAKPFSRLIRINTAIRLLNNCRNSITLVSDLTGFHDLPHFIHDFKSVCGVTPQEYRNNISDFYSEIAKFDGIL